MNEQLKVGDRVRVFADTPADKPIEKYLSYFDIGELTGTVTRATKNGYIVRSDDGREGEFLGVCMELIERPRRTFEEIIASIESKTDHFFFDGRIYKNNENMAVFCTDGYGHAQIKKEGSFCGYCPAKYVPIIFAACSEIAANYEAEHGKEDA